MSGLYFAPFSLVKLTKPREEGRESEIFIFFTMPTVFVQIPISRAQFPKPEHGTTPRAWIHTGHPQPHEELKWTQGFRSGSNLPVGSLLLQLPRVQ